jgi:hypothetical protein
MVIIGYRKGETMMRPNIGLELMRMRLDDLRRDAGPLRRPVRRRRHVHHGHEAER